MYVCVLHICIAISITSVTTTITVLTRPRMFWSPCNFRTDDEVYIKPSNAQTNRIRHITNTARFEVATSRPEGASIVLLLLLLDFNIWQALSIFDFWTDDEV